MSAPTLRLAEVDLTLGGHRLLTAVNLTVEGGGALGLIGPGGAGKTLALKLLAGLLPPSAGAVWWDALRLDRLAPSALSVAQRRVGMVFQNNALFDTLSVADNIAFPLKRTGVSDREAQARVEVLLRQIRLEGAGAKLPHQLSGGMKKRVCLARAVAHRPPILLCDDPTAGLDPVTTRRIFDLLLALRAETGATLVVASHEVEALCGLCDHLALFEAGAVRFAGSVAQARASADPLLRAFLTGEGVA